MRSGAYLPIVIAAIETGFLLVLLAAAVAAAPIAGAASTGKNAARAEVQLELCAPADQVVPAPNMHPRAVPITVWQFDDNALSLYARGLRLRLRATPDGRSELTLKASDVDCRRIGPTTVPPGEGKCEYDVYGANTTGSVSLNRRLDPRRTAGLLAGRITLAQTLSSAQIAYLRDQTGSWPLPHGVRKLGPIALETYRCAADHYDLDISRLPDGQRYVEIARKVPLADAASAMEDMRRHLSAAGVATCSDQSSQALGRLRALLRQQ
jgi:hypothetical protein